MKNKIIRKKLNLKFINSVNCPLSEYERRLALELIEFNVINCKLKDEAKNEEALMKSIFGGNK